jgi:hypothetical protein
MDSGDPDRVVVMRHELQRVMTKRFTKAGALPSELEVHGFT